MFKFDIKKIFMAVHPFLILVLAWILAMDNLGSLKKFSIIFATLPYVLAFFCLLLSVWFQHSRTFYAVCILLFAMASVSSFKEMNHQALINGLSLIIPAAFIFLAAVKERGITSRYGLAKGLVFIALIFAVLLDADRTNPWLAGLKEAKPFLDNAEIVAGIPRLSVFLFIVCLCILIARSLLLASNMDIAFTGATLGSFLILHFTEYSDVLSIFFSAVFLIFMIALFQTSYSLAFHDTLTGVLSRRALEQEMLRLGKRFAVAMVDIDHFKHVNDKYGHKVGDDVLKMIASMIEKNADGGKTFRYGGEEFVVIFPRRSADEIYETMDQLREAIEKRPLVIRSPKRPKHKPKTKIFRECGSEKIKVTISIGIADKNERLQSAGHVIEAADKALYKAKKSGRNCVVQ
jgi:diguanylate cyclase (GGDEF)-like protein